METKIKTIDINAKEWFDKINGNSYFAGTVCIDYALPTQQNFVMSFQYGYGDQYLHTGLSLLKEKGFINTISTYELRNQNIILRHSIQHNCKQRELKTIS